MAVKHEYTFARTLTIIHRRKHCWRESVQPAANKVEDTHPYTNRICECNDDEVRNEVRKWCYRISSVAVPSLFHC